MYHYTILKKSLPRFLCVCLQAENAALFEQQAAVNHQIHLHMDAQAEINAQMLGHLRSHDSSIQELLVHGELLSM